MRYRSDAACMNALSVRCRKIHLPEPAQFSSCAGIAQILIKEQSVQSESYAKGYQTMQKKLPPCPVETTLMLISDRWRVLILRDLLDGTRRNGELMRSLSGISQKVLTANLRAMERDGLLTRKVYPEVPPRVEYSLTETGVSLKPVLDAMKAWGEGYKRKIKEGG